jgi:hypothetical protein
MTPSLRRKSMLNLFLAVVALLIVAVVGARWYGSSRWTDGTKELRAALAATRVPSVPRHVSFSALHELPAPVQRYFRAVLKDGQPYITGVHLRHTGTFNMSETGEQWKSFTSDQAVVTHRPGFDWDGRIAMLPGLPVHVHDAYVSGEGVLHASLAGVLSLADLRGGDDLARGELMRFLAEAVWYPTALLPSQGVSWIGLDDNAAMATLTDGAVTVSLRFTFTADWLVDTVYAEARSRTVAGTMVPTPWQGRFWNYVDRSGVRVPVDGEVAWLLPEGPKPYWRGHMTDIAFEVAP